MTHVVRRVMKRKENAHAGSKITDLDEGDDVNICDFYLLRF